jgi:hypothetical protein
MAYQYGGKLRGAEDPWAEPEPSATERQLPRGVQYDKRTRTYIATIKHRGKRLYNGTNHPTTEAAHQAVKELRARTQAADPEWQGTKSWGQLKPCGTHAAYHRHLRHGQKPCQPCVRAETRYVYTMRKPKAA